MACSGDGGDDTSGEGTATSAAASGVPDSSGAAGEMQFGDLQMLKDAIELAGLRLCDLAKLTDSGDYEQLLYQAFLGFCIPGKDGDGAVMIESWSDPVRPPAAGGHGLVGYHWAQYQVSVLPGSDPEVIALFLETMNELEGAEPAFDYRPGG